MKTTIDKAGRLVVPKDLREKLGLAPGEVELSVEGAALRVEPVAGDEVIDQDGLLVIPSAGTVVTTEAVRSLLESDRQ